MPTMTQTEFETLLETVSRRLEEAEGTLTAFAREALVLAIVQDVAVFVLDWSESDARVTLT